jgi:mono/diheme cytochrome c family protein
MFRLCALQLPLIVDAIACAALMSRGIGLPSSGPPPSTHPGAAIYAAHCQTCDQPDGRGLGGKAAGDFVGNAAILAQSDEALLTTIARGKTGHIGTMPAWGSILTPQQQRDVLAYIRQTFGGSPAR